MHFERLTKHESKIVGEALRAAADGSFFPVGEFHTLFGLHREQVRRISDEWPLPKCPHDEVRRAVQNAMNSLLGYPPRKQDLWSEWISVDQNVMKDLLIRLVGTKKQSQLGGGTVSQRRR